MTISALTPQQLASLIVSYSGISLKKERYEKILSDFFLYRLEISFSKIEPCRVLWLHAGNNETTNVVNVFKKVTGNICVIEIFSLDELSDFTKKTIPHLFKTIVTEMGFWEDKNKNTFDKTAGLRAMLALNNWAPELKNKFVISARVGRNEESLKDHSEKLGFIHASAFEPIQQCLPLLSLREKELHQCISQLKESLFSKPIVSPNQQNSYPIKHFNIDFVFDIENAFNKQQFLKKQHEFFKSGKPIDWDWQFHGSSSKGATYNVGVSNFSLMRLGEYSGNRGCYGEGIYFSPRGYMPMYISIVQGHLMVLACKVMKGTSQIIKHLSKEDYAKGIPISPGFDSNISDNLNEVIISNSKQVLPSFIIKFSVKGLEKLGDVIWNTPKGDKTYPDIFCNGERLNSFC